MKKYTYSIIAVVLFVATAALASDLTWTPGLYIHGPSQAPVQTYGPDGSKTAALTVNRTSVVDLTTYLMYGVWSASGTCYERLMPSATSTLASYTQTPVPNTSWHVRSVNPSTPFATYSGCVSGYLTKQ